MRAVLHSAPERKPMPKAALRNSMRKPVATYLFLLIPALALFTAFIVVPVFQSGLFSLYKWNGLGPLKDFRRLDNYKLLFNNPVFIKAMYHTFLVVVVSLIAELPIALGFALIIGDNKFRGAVFFRTVFFLPYVISEVITGILWQFIYHPQYGLVKSIFALLKPEAVAPALLANPQTVLWAIMGVIIWKYFGLHMTLYIAGLQDIPQELKEAARIDGANAMQVFRHVTFPLLRTIISISVLLSVLGSIQIFDVVWAMGKGDPVNSAETMVTFMYKFGLQRFQIGYGGAVAVVIFFICLGFTAVYLKSVVKEEK
jgi:raffinose/stachyose/melibiose transport system permease protein